jgi:hypothetical protein
MNTNRRLRRIAICVAAVLGGLFFAPQAAHAGTLDTVLQFLGYVPEIGPYASTINDGRALFGCLAEKGDLVSCSSANTDAGSTALAGAIGSEGALPPWLDQAIRVYLDIKAEDWGNLIIDASLAAVCAAAQIVGGEALSTLCSLLRDLIALAKEILEDLEKYVDWVMTALKNVWCATLGKVFGGCGDDGSVPVYVGIFVAALAGKVPDGVATVWKGGDDRKAQARADANGWATTWVNDYANSIVESSGGWGGSGLSKESIRSIYLSSIPAALDLYMDAVGKAWAGEFAACYAGDTAGVRPARANMSNGAAVEAIGRLMYAKGEYNVDASGNVSAKNLDTECVGVQNFAAGASSVCRFVKEGWDAWIADNQASASSLKMLNAQKWCTSVWMPASWHKIDDLMQHLHDEQLFRESCPAGTDGLPLCTSAEAYNNCLTRATKAGTESSQCHMDLTAFCPRGSSGKLICTKNSFNKCRDAARIAHLDGSECTLNPAAVCPLRPLDGRYYCTSTSAHDECRDAATSVGINPDLCSYDVRAAAADLAKGITNILHCTIKQQAQSAMSLEGKPLIVECTRKIQQHNCLKMAVPELVECTLNEDTAYAQTASQVASAVSVMNTRYSNAHATTGLDPLTTGQDPLVVTVDPQWWQTILADDSENHWGVSPQFAYQKMAVAYNPNGINLPPIVTAGQGDQKVQKPPLTTLGSVGTQARVEAAVQGLGKVNQTRINPDAGIDTPGVGPDAKGKLVMNDGGITAMAPGAKNLPGAARPGVAGSTTQVMSATLPADITSADQLVIAGQPARWGSAVTVDASRALARNMSNSGLCGFAFDVTAQNLGMGATGQFTSVWTNSAVPGRWPHSWAPLDPQSSRMERDVLALKPGDNQMQLMLDDMNQVRESNENNNNFRVKVTVTGSCNTTAPSATPAALAPTAVRPPLLTATPAAAPPASGIKLPPALPKATVTPTPGRVAPTPVAAPSVPVLTPPSVPLPAVGTPTSTPTPAASVPKAKVPGPVSAPVIATPTPTPTPTPARRR